MRLAGEVVFVTARTFAYPLPAAGDGTVLRTMSQSLSLVAFHAHAAGAVTLMVQLASPTPTASAVLSTTTPQGAGAVSACAVEWLTIIAAAAATTLLTNLPNRNERRMGSPSGCRHTSTVLG